MKRLLLVFGLLLPFALCVAKTSGNVHHGSSIQIDESTFITHDGKEMYTTRLDTVIIVMLSKDEATFKVKRPGKCIRTKEDGYFVRATFSNGLDYIYTFLNADAKKDFEQKRSNHIYNARIGDIVVVKVKVPLSSDPEILEFVENLSLKR